MPPATERRCLVVGYGSIGARHAAILARLSCRVACVTRRADVPFPVFPDLSAALAGFDPELVIIATPTAGHLDACRRLEATGYAGTVLIEKPLDAHPPADGFTPSYPAFVAYNLRFHPLILRLRERLADRRIFAAQLTVGQHLPSWRPGVDYRASYSASREQGGGVLRDLSHELDLAVWLFGPWQAVTARMGAFGDLGIPVEDSVDLLLQTGACPAVNIHLDYHNRFPVRRITVQAEGTSLEGDLIRGVLRSPEGEESFSVERDTTYTAQLEALLRNDHRIPCGFTGGLEVMRLIEVAENAARRETWEKRP